MDTQSRLLALDWGTTSLRAYRLGDNGQQLECRELPYGIMKLPEHKEGRIAAFRETFFTACSDWLQAGANPSVIACGMVGSAQGWKEATYLPCPTSLTGLASQLCRLNITHSISLSIVPGLAVDGSDPEVMRGEETQIFGILCNENNNADEMIIGMPGTHSKWALTQQNCVLSFHTFMTGEVFDALRHHTILGSTMQNTPETDWQTFDDGVATAIRQAKAGLLCTLFSTRTKLLSGHISSQQQADYLSGLVIGHELIGIRQTLLISEERRQCTPIMLTGNTNLCERYQRAFRQAIADRPLKFIAQATAAGLWQIASLARLISDA
ncbi:2-dehydro-3-deoxygalactonokinase [Klebsiella indica]|uniref:2-dehydro-3-deoxygalactonokinase n=2 Tax=Klebsiella indica TaxID=2582917 RepID=A0A5R9LEG4_9ENTR|nr:2-dehydro-3-deoxygalactonokinase [Klebsiella indica]